MKDEKTTDEQVTGRDAKKEERRAAMAEFKRLHAVDPQKAREAARLWFERNAAPVEEEKSAFHLRKLREADPERITRAAQAADKCAADAERAQSASRETVKEWKKRNPNKVKKLKKLHVERHKSK